MKLHVSAALAALIPALLLAAPRQEIPLIDPDNPADGWSFDNGQEFPGAKGGMAVDDTVDPPRRPALRLDADLSQGGAYVQIGRFLPAIDLEAVSFWMKTPGGGESLTLRLVDGSGQCHQFDLRVEGHDRWQQVVLPVSAFFEKAGTSAAIDCVGRYEKWGGANDGRWHNPAKGLYLLNGSVLGPEKKGSILFSDVKLVAEPPRTVVTKTIRLDEFLQEGEVDWSLNLGWEFPGAKGSLDILEAADAGEGAEDGIDGLTLEGDFTGGGIYISAERELDGLDVVAVRMKMRTPNVKSFNVRYVDGSGQCHQGHGFDLVADDRWHEITIPVAEVAGGEHWGGANDGAWHPGAKLIALLIGKGDDAKPVLMMRDIVADVASKVVAAGDGYRESFDGADALPAGWSLASGPAGSAAICGDAPFDGEHCLRLSLDEDALIAGKGAIEVLGAPFAAAPGPWSVGAAVRSALHSPDNSFTVRLHVDALDASGAPLSRATLVDQCGTAAWRAIAREIELPPGTDRARFAATFHKTHGTCDFDALSAMPVESRAEERIVSRILIDGRPRSEGGAKITNGHLFLPEAPLDFEIGVETFRPIPEECRFVRLVATDYWGAEQFDSPLDVPLERTGLANRRFSYAGRVHLPPELFEVGKYYELHASVHVPGFADGTEYSAFARLPEAEANRHSPKDIPFSIRNWDSRIYDYFVLAARIGHRNIGLWGDSGWQDVERLGADWYSGSRAAEVERDGWRNITEEQLRDDTAQFLFRHREDRIACYMLGNEPNERPELAAEKVKAYRIVYEAAKSVAPEIPVIGTSVPALDCFFEAGYGECCDVYDFHVYETYRNVREGVRRYKEMGRKYGCEKPVWCTELGLNSQGQTRYAVAKELVKKITSFFAEGGANVSWFTIQYPDGEGKARGTGGDAHNTFDCQYCLYNPRLDAIMYYSMINGICVKKFAGEIQRPDGVQEYLFRDEATGECLFVAWRDSGRLDRAILLPKGARDIGLTRIDGSHQPLAPDASGAVTLGISEEPVLLRFTAAADTTLAEERGEAAISVDPDHPLAILKGRTRSIRVTCPGLVASELSAAVPPRWTVEMRQDGDGAVVCTVGAPEDTTARAGRVAIQRRAADAGAPCAELVLTLPIMSPVSMEVGVLARDSSGEPGIRMEIANNAADEQEVSWTVELTGAWGIRGGTFALNEPGAPSAYLREGGEGRAALAPDESRTVEARIAGCAPGTIYRIRAALTDSQGRSTVVERYAGGFASAVRATGPVAIDGAADEPFWADAQAEMIDGADCSFRFGGDVPAWRGPDDLSATWRAAWDDRALYLLVDVRDDVHHVQFADGAIWNQDGLQFLFDPLRTSSEKSGKYDYSAGVGTKGPQAWCHLAAHSSVGEGEAPFELAATQLPGSQGGRRYELAIPWKCLAPFEPVPCADLGMSMILNEDDGDGRIGFSGWFSGPHSKDLSHVGDLVLLP